MTSVTDTVRHEIEELHVFFTDWFNGTIDPSALETRLLARLAPEFVVVPPNGSLMTVKDLAGSIRQGHGANPDFRIQIRDVTVRFNAGDHVVATYTEWQTGARNSDHARNARISTVLLKMGDPIQWLHLQETWLPEAVRAADPFDF